MVADPNRPNPAGRVVEKQTFRSELTGWRGFIAQRPATEGSEVERRVGRSRYAEKVHIAVPPIVLHAHVLADEGVVLHNFVEISQHEHSTINAL